MEGDSEGERVREIMTKIKLVVRGKMLDAGTGGESTVRTANASTERILVNRW